MNERRRVFVVDDVMAVVQLLGCFTKIQGGGLTSSDSAVDVMDPDSRSRSRPLNILQCHSQKFDKQTLVQLLVRRRPYLIW